VGGRESGEQRRSMADGEDSRGGEKREGGREGVCDMRAQQLVVGMEFRIQRSTGAKKLVLNFKNSMMR
jgi:hypothetical protein